MNSLKMAGKFIVVHWTLVKYVQINVFVFYRFLQFVDWSSGKVFSLQIPSLRYRICVFELCFTARRNMFIHTWIVFEFKEEFQSVGKHSIVLLTSFCKYQKLKIPVYFLFLWKWYLTYVNVCWSWLEHGHFCLVSARLSLSDTAFSRDTIS